MKMKTLVILCLSLCFLGCTSTELKIYVEADKATFHAIADEYLTLVKTIKNDKNDNFFNTQQIERRERLIASWKLRIENAEQTNTK